MPLLTPHQDPDGLEARVAFHLHRLGLTGTALTRIGFGRMDAADLAAARMPLTKEIASSIAQRLGIPDDELTRSLTPDETADWAFYRYSERAGNIVWQRAFAHAENAGMTSYRFAAVIGLDHNLVRRVMSARKRLVFTRRMAVALTEVTGSNPEHLLPEIPQRSS